eukprot:2878591-Prymnesium_polylepis.1
MLTFILGGLVHLRWRHWRTRRGLYKAESHDTADVGNDVEFNASDSSSAQMTQMTLLFLSDQYSELKVWVRSWPWQTLFAFLGCQYSKLKEKCSKLEDKTRSCLQAARSWLAVSVGDGALRSWAGCKRSAESVMKAAKKLPEQPWPSEFVSEGEVEASLGDAAAVVNEVAEARTPRRFARQKKGASGKKQGKYVTL